MKNKEILIDLKGYLLKQDPDVVALFAASLLLDMHRLCRYASLPKEEAECLVKRVKWNSKQFEEFAENGPKDSFKVEVVSSAEDVPDGDK